MELRITNPQENWLTEQILWNNEDLKAAIAEKVKDYKTIAYTEDSLKDMKADRADLNKLKKAFEDERKRVKKICMEPYTKFEQQVKEITALIDEPIGLIDSQIREIDERRKAAKREEIEELFTSIGFQSFVKLDMSGVEFTCEFNDSILADEESERQQDRQDVSMGVMSLLEYRMKWYNEDEETAKAKLPEQNQVME